ncbi:MAG: hypothetical protein CYG60_03765, partial [Actinobacteria bacterium]
MRGVGLNRRCGHGREIPALSQDPAAPGRLGAGQGRHRAGDARGALAFLRQPAAAREDRRPRVQEDRRHQPRHGHTDPGVARRPARLVALLRSGRAPYRGPSWWSIRVPISRTLRPGREASVWSRRPGRAARALVLEPEGPPDGDATRRSPLQHQPDPNRIHRISPDDRQRSGPNAITSISRRPQLSPALCDAIDSLARFVGPLPDFLRTLAARAAEALEVRSAEVLELVPEGFVSRARHDFPLAFDEESPLGHDTHAGWAVRTGETLSTNYVFENRFPNDYLRDHGIKSGITTAIGATDGGTSSPWGVLAVHDAKSRDYSADEILFMEKAADLAAAFIRRDAQEQARLREERDRAKHETRRRRTAEYRLGYTAEACQAAAVAVTTRAALKSVARHAVPEIADWCFVDVVP